MNNNKVHPLVIVAVVILGLTLLSFVFRFLQWVVKIGIVLFILYFLYVNFIEKKSPRGPNQN